MIGSSIRTNAGIPLDYSGFLVKSRYWRLVMANNYGAHMTTFHGVEFFGFDCRISKLLSELGLSEYEDILIENVNVHSYKFDKLLNLIF